MTAFNSLPQHLSLLCVNYVDCPLVLGDGCELRQCITLRRDRLCRWKRVSRSEIRYAEIHALIEHMYVMIKSIVGGNLQAHLVIALFAGLLLAIVYACERATHEVFLVFPLPPTS